MPTKQSVPVLNVVRLLVKRVAAVAEPVVVRPATDRVVADILARVLPKMQLTAMAVRAMVTEEVRL